ncbi:MAG: HEAT repeat domain-containing protein [Pirellulaceae bacterium]
MGLRAGEATAEIQRKIDQGLLCAGCWQERKRSDWMCPKCDYTRVGDLLVAGGGAVVVALVLLLIGLSSPLFVALLLYFLALACLALPVSKAVKAIRTPKRYKEMESSNPDRAVAFTEWLAEHGGERSVGSFIDMMGDSRKPVRQAALAALTKLWERGEIKNLDLLKPLLKDYQPEVDAEILKFLAIIRDWKIADLLFNQAWYTPVSEKRESFLQLIVELDTERALKLFAAQEGRASSDVRYAMLRAVGRIRQPDYIPLLASMLTPKSGTTAPFLEDGLLVALKYIGKPAVGPLVELAKNPDVHPDLRKKVRVALVEIKDPRAIEVLAAMLEGGYPDVGFALEALAKFEDSGVANQLVAAFPKVRDSSVRVWIAEAVAKRDDPRAADLIRQVRKDQPRFSSPELIQYLLRVDHTAAAEMMADCMSAVSLSTGSNEQFATWDSLATLGRLDLINLYVLQEMTQLEDRKVFHTVVDYPASHRDENERGGHPEVTHEEYDHTISYAAYREAARKEIARRKAVSGPTS